MKGSLIIVGFFILGCLSGLFNIVPGEECSDISFYALCALMFCVGLSIGNDSQTIKNFRSLNPRLVMLPIMTIVGTLAGTALASIVVPNRSIAEYSCAASQALFEIYQNTMELLEKQHETISIN